MPELEKPLVPKPDNTGIENFQKGFALVGQLAQQKRESELRLLQMAEQERQHEENFGLQKEHLELQKRTADSLIDYRKNVEMPAALRSLNNQKAIQTISNEAAQRAEELGLDNADFQTKQPIKYAANVLTFNDEFGTAPSSTGIPAAMKRYRTTADQLKIPLVQRITDDQGKVIEVQKPTPAWQIVQNLQNPSTRSQMEQMLQDSGHMHKIDDTSSAISSTSPLHSLLSSAKGVDFTKRSKSRLPAIMGTKITSDTVTDPQFYPTQTDTVIQQARDAISGGAPRSAIEQKLQQMQIDPNLLDQ